MGSGVFTNGRFWFTICTPVWNRTARDRPDRARAKLNNKLFPLKDQPSDTGDVVQTAEVAEGERSPTLESGKRPGARPALARCRGGSVRSCGSAAAPSPGGRGFPSRAPHGLLCASSCSPLRLLPGSQSPRGARCPPPHQPAPPAACVVLAAAPLPGNTRKLGNQHLLAPARAPCPVMFRQRALVSDAIELK